MANLLQNCRSSDVGDVFFAVELSVEVNLSQLKVTDGGDTKQLKPNSGKDFCVVTLILQ